MAQPQIQTSFAAGELAPSLWGHVDYARYNIGAATARNFFVSYRGGMFSRAGTAFVGYSRQTVANIGSGFFSYSGQPNTGDTITINGITFTYTNTPGPYTLPIGGNLAGTILLTTFQLPPNANNIVQLTVASYALDSGHTKLNITYNSQTSASDSFTLAATGGIITPSGPHLVGGGNFPPRLITFQFSLNQGLVLEFGNLYMRVISNGAFVTETPKTITGATKANPCVIHAVAHGFTTGDWVFISGVGGMTQLNGLTYIITVTDADHFSLQDVFGNNIDSSSFTTYTSGGTAARLYTLVTPYAAVDLDFLKFTQSADVMSLTCRNQVTGTEYVPYDLARLADDNWTLTALSTAASIAAPTNAIAGSNVTTALTGMTNYQYCVTAIDTTTGDESIASNIANIADSVDISSQAGSNTIRWDGVAGALYYNIYKAPPAYMATIPDGSLFGFAGSVFGRNFVDSNIQQDMSIVPPLHQNPFSPGPILSATITGNGSGLFGPIGFTITTAHGAGAAGYGIIIGGEMFGFVFTNSGHDYAPGDTIVFFDEGGTQATGNLAFSAQPNDGDTITLNGQLITYTNTPGSGIRFPIGGNLAGTLFLSVLALPPNANNIPALTPATYARRADNLHLDITYATPGPAGNAYTLAATGGIITPSGANLTGGTGGTAPTGTLNVGPTSGTYPSVVAYFQERRVYGNTANQPDTYFMSQPGSFKNFDSRVPSLDTDSIVGTPWSVQVDGIQFMLPLLSGLIVLTGQTAYQVMGSGGSPSNPQAVTPSSQQALPQAYNGCHFHVPPVKIDYDVYYLQAKGSIIRSLSYNFWINVFTGVDVTYLSSHLFTGFSIEDMAWAEEPFKIMWCVRDDGILLSLTSLKSQEIMGWCRHDTQGLFVAATTVTEPPVDALYVSTQRFTPNGKMPFMIERLDNRLWPTVEDCWCVDCGLELPQEAPNSTLTASSAAGLGTPSGVTNLDGGAAYSASTTAMVQDPTGEGCDVTLTIASGIITSVSFSGGTGYTDPTVVVSDPLDLGTGFSCRVVLTNTATFVSDAPVFDSGMVGWVIRGGGGVAQITAFTDEQTVTAALVAPIVKLIPNTVDTPQPLMPNQWTLTEPITTVTGLNHLAGMTVTGLADGNPILPQEVSAAGTISLRDPASAIVIGLGFQAQLQSLYLEGGNPTVQGRRKKVGAATARLEASGSVEVGSNQPDGSALSPARTQTLWTSLTAMDTSSAGLAKRAYGNAVIDNTTYVRPVPLFTGDIRATITSSFEKPGQVAVQQLLPLPAQILDFMKETEEGDTPERDPRPR